MTSFSGSLQTPVPHNVARGLCDQQFDSMVANLPMSLTYANVLNVEEYKASVIASPSFSPTNGINEPNQSLAIGPLLPPSSRNLTELYTIFRPSISLSTGLRGRSISYPRACFGIAIFE